MLSVSREVAYLGDIVRENGVLADPGNISNVADWSVLQKLSELCAFLSTVEYYRQYVEDCASKARPLTELTGYGFQWTDE